VVFDLISEQSASLFVSQPNFLQLFLSMRYGFHPNAAGKPSQPLCRPLPQKDGGSQATNESNPSIVYE
jgi:hypothetical protein